MHIHDAPMPAPARSPFRRFRRNVVFNTTFLEAIMVTVSASDANRNFSALLREVAHGRSYTVLSRGKPVATLGPVQSDARSRKVARKALLARLHAQPATGARGWSRDELYER